MLQFFKSLWSVSLDMYQGTEVTRQRAIDKLYGKDLWRSGKTPNLNGIIGHMGLKSNSYTIFFVCKDMMFKWKLKDSPECDCGNNRQTMRHITDEWPNRRFESGINGINEVTKGLGHRNLGLTKYYILLFILFYFNVTVVLLP